MDTQFSNEQCGVRAFSSERRRWYIHIPPEDRTNSAAPFIRVASFVVMHVLVTGLSFAELVLAPGVAREEGKVEEGVLLFVELVLAPGITREEGTGAEKGEFGVVWATELYDLGKVICLGDEYQWTAHR
jgi:hypothetical protein